MIAEQWSDEERIKYGARLVLSRDPTDREIAALRGTLSKNCCDARVAARRCNNAATILREFSAMTAVASVLINLDAALTR